MSLYYIILSKMKLALETVYQANLAVATFVLGANKNGLTVTEMILLSTNNINVCTDR